MENRFLTSSSSSSSSSSDDDEPRYRRPRIYRERRHPIEEYDDVDFKMRFRLSKECVQQVLDLILPNLQLSEKNQAVTPMNQQLLTLRYYATGSFQICTGDHFNVSKSSVCRIVHNVSHQIALLRPEFIHMPRNPNELIEVQNDFYAWARFPRVLGAIDCTHIRIQSPGGENAEMYRNRKGWFSINVQALCDAKLKFMDIIARWPGSVHDSTIFHDSLLRARLENNEFPDTYLMGDSGYACKPYMLTPLLNPQGGAENAYNYAQIKARNPIERAFGVMKRRFLCLSIGMRLGLNKVLSIIVATAVLHNIAVDAADPEPDADLDIQIPILDHPGVARGIDGNDNGAVRRAVINTIFANR